MIRQLKHLAGEYRSARHLPLTRAFAELSRLDGFATDLVESACESGCLKWLFRDGSKGPEAAVEVPGFITWSCISGYDHFYTKEVEEIEFRYDRPVEIVVEHCFLMPGYYLGPDTGFTEFQPIDLGVNCRDPGYMLQEKINRIFEIMGYRARACEILISSIENQVASQKQVDADVGNRHDVLTDGLSSDKRSFRWNGKTYTLGLAPSKVVELLHNRYLDGEYFVHEQFIKTECDVGSDMRHIVRDNHLEDLIVRQKKPNGKTTNGMWGLNPK